MSNYLNNIKLLWQLFTDFKEFFLIQMELFLVIYNNITLL